MLWSSILSVKKWTKKKNRWLLQQHSRKKKRKKKSKKPEALKATYSRKKKEKKKKKRRKKKPKRYKRPNGEIYRMVGIGIASWWPELNGGGGSWTVVVGEGGGKKIWREWREKMKMKTQWGLLFLSFLYFFFF
jgi:hypothetical protein